ncbi:MAG: ABC transporter permease [Acidimicrobiales bacterium]
MYLTKRARLVLRSITWAALAVLYLPLVYVLLLSFNSSKSFTMRGFTLHWWPDTLAADGPREALVRSLITAIGATSVALVLGTMAAFALSRFAFFGRDSLNLLIVLPIALPGIVTGLALNATFRQLLDIELGYGTLIVAHATFCIVVVFNNVAARLRRLSPSLEEASADLGADMFQTFRHVTFPLMRTALVAGALLAFALSFDEIVVTNFTGGKTQTLPLWIFNNMFRPNNLPQVNVVAVIVVVLSIVPVFLSQRLTSGDA